MIVIGMKSTGYYAVEESLFQGCTLPDVALMKSYIFSIRTLWDDSWVCWHKAKMPICNKVAVFFNVLSFFFYSLGKENFGTRYYHERPG